MIKKITGNKPSLCFAFILKTFWSDGERTKKVYHAPEGTSGQGSRYDENRPGKVQILFLIFFVQDNQMKPSYN